MHIAIFNNDPAELRFVTDTLMSAGYSCQTFSEVRSLLHALQHGTFDLAIFRWDADIEVVAMLAGIRHHCDTELPILVISCHLRERDVVDALNAGADDFLVQPIAAPVLLARITTLLRRCGQRASAVARQQQFGEYRFDLQEGRVSWRGERIALSQKEFRVALLLFQNLGRPLSRASLIESVWRHSADVPSRTLDTHVSSVRTKLHLRAENGYVLISIYRYGYCLQAAAEGAQRSSVHSGQCGTRANAEHIAEVAAA